MLYQNIPNPFGDNTTINYFLPKGVIQAEMVFYDNFGRQVKTVQINNRGNGSIQVDATDLASGIYTYSLVADGQVLDTKKMIRAK